MSWDKYRNNYIRKQEEADGWQDFHSKFMQLANEEAGIVRAKKKDLYLRAYCDYNEHPEIWGEKESLSRALFCLLKTPPCGVWVLDDGVSENFQARFRALAARAGVALGSPEGTDPEDFWLHRLYLDLLDNNSEQLFAASKVGGVIRRVCVASATFCSRLERKALEQSEPGNRTGAERLRSGANQAQGSLAQNSDKTAQSVEGKSTNAAVGNTREAVARPIREKEGSRSRRVAKTTPQPVELGKGGIRFVRQGEYTVALPCGTSRDAFDGSTVSALRVSYDILCEELPKVYSIVKTKGGEIGGAELRKQFRRSQLTGVADEHDWNDWAENFSPKNAQRGRPKGAALTFLERKTTLDRGTIKSYLSKSKKRPRQGK